MWDVGCGMWDVGCRKQGIRYGIQNAECRMWDVGCEMWDIGSIDLRNPIFSYSQPDVALSWCILSSYIKVLLPKGGRCQKKRKGHYN
jgi:hypothetical protein